MVSCGNCGADQFVDADADRYSCGACHQAFLLRQCPACTNVVHLADWGGRLGCPVCGRGFSHRRWARNPGFVPRTRAATAVSRATYDKPDPHHRVVAGTGRRGRGRPGAGAGGHRRARVQLRRNHDLVRHRRRRDRRARRGATTAVKFLRVTGRGGSRTPTSDAGRGPRARVGRRPAGRGVRELSSTRRPARRRRTSRRSCTLRARGHGDPPARDRRPPPQLAVRAPGAGLRPHRGSPASHAHSPPRRRRQTVVDQLAKLGGLHQAGLLTVDEFNAAKRRLLGR